MRSENASEKSCRGGESDRQKQHSRDDAEGECASSSGLYTKITNGARHAIPIDATIIRCRLSGESRSWIVP